MRFIKLHNLKTGRIIPTPEATYEKLRREQDFDKNYLFIGYCDENGDDLKETTNQNSNSTENGKIGTFSETETEAVKDESNGRTGCGQGNDAASVFGNDKSGAGDPTADTKPAGRKPATGGGKKPASKPAAKPAGRKPATGGGKKPASKPAAKPAGKKPGSK